MTRALLGLALLGLLAAPASAARNPRLRAFSSCASLAAYARAHAGPAGPSRTDVQPTVQSPPAQTPQATGDSGQGQPGAASGTNVQEPGIDEPDLVKTEGSTLFTAVDGALRAIDVSTPTPTLLSSLPLEGSDAQILAHDGRLLVITREFQAVPEQPDARPCVPSGR
jgi:uncharacterized secreted protein with C-terminal beta-propeller domain